MNAVNDRVCRKCRTVYTPRLKSNWGITLIYVAPILIINTIRDVLHHKNYSEFVVYSFVAIFFALYVAFAFSIMKYNFACPKCKNTKSVLFTSPEGQLLTRVHKPD
jgi:hypothetical protein